jgi:hypothetical protein
MYDQDGEISFRVSPQERTVVPPHVGIVKAGYLDGHSPYLDKQAGIR